MGRLLLWDVDGTLIHGHGIGSAALTGAAASVLGRPVSLESVTIHGKTDPQILAELFRAAAVDDTAIPGLLPAAMAETERRMAGAEDVLRSRGELIDGAEAVLARLAARPGVRQTLVTGNLAANTTVKLAAFDLTRYFDVEVSATGTDHADRNALVPIALERVRRLRGEVYPPADVWVIGDTPADLACARAAGVRCLLVGTGAIPLAELAALDPDAVLPDLIATDTVAAILAA